MSRLAAIRRDIDKQRKFNKEMVSDKAIIVEAQRKATMPPSPFEMGGVQTGRTKSRSGPIIPETIEGVDLGHQGSAIFSNQTDFDNYASTVYQLKADMSSNSQMAKMQALGFASVPPQLSQAFRNAAERREELRLRATVLRAMISQRGVNNKDVERFFYYLGCVTEFTALQWTNMIQNVLIMAPGDLTIALWTAETAKRLPSHMQLRFSKWFEIIKSIPPQMIVRAWLSREILLFIHDPEVQRLDREKLEQ